MRIWNIQTHIDEIVIQCLEAHGYRKELAAEALGVSRRTLTNWLKQYREQGREEIYMPNDPRLGVKLAAFAEMIDNEIDFEHVCEHLQIGLDVGALWYRDMFLIKRSRVGGDA